MRIAYKMTAQFTYLPSKTRLLLAMIPLTVAVFRGTIRGNETVTIIKWFSLLNRRLIKLSVPQPSWGGVSPTYPAESCGTHAVALPIQVWKLTLMRRVTNLERAHSGSLLSIPQLNGEKKTLKDCHLMNVSSWNTRITNRTLRNRSKLGVTRGCL